MDTKGNRVTYLGHSAFLLTTAAGSVGIIDPFLQNPNCPEEFKRLEKLDVIFLSHAHGDHLGDTVQLGKKHKSAIACIFETGLWLNQQGLQDETKPMGKGGTQKIGQFDVTMTQAMHSNSIEDGKDVVYAGEPAGLLIRMPGGFSIYHAGDTCLFSDMKLIGELYKPDVALLPIGDHFTMGPREAAMAVKFLGVKHVVPMHYATFPVLTGTPEEFRKECAGIAGVTVHVLQPGESLGASAAASGRGD